MAVRQIERAVILEPEDIEAMRSPFVNKGNSDPIVRAFRDALKESVPKWISDLDDDSRTVSRSRLDELLAAVRRRRQLVETLPDGTAKTDSLNALATLETLVSDMIADLDGSKEN